MDGESQSEKFARIVKRHKPKGWRLAFSKRRNDIAEKCRLNKLKDADMAKADAERRVIAAPYVIDAYTLHILLHEFGHVQLKHWSTGAATLHREEFEAERWAMEIMRIEGVAVSAETKRDVRLYLCWCIKQDRANGIEIEPHIERFAGKDRK